MPVAGPSARRLACALSTLLVVSCGGAAGAKPKATWLMPVQVQPVAERVVAREIRGGGTLDPADVVQITSRVAGVVERVAFNAGDRLAAGQVLVEIEPERFRLAVARAKAVLGKADAQVSEARAALTRRRQLATHGEGLVTAEEIATWESHLAQAEADAALAKAGMDQAELDARDASIRAPIAATVESRSVRTGQFLAVGTVVATQVQRLPLRLRARVPTTEAAALSVGQPVRVVPASGSELAGRIVLVGAMGDAATRTVDVVAEVASAEETVVAGGFAELIATAGGGGPQPAVPQSALRATERGYIGFVVTTEDGRSVAHSRIVETGMRSADGWVEIRSGLATGESLIILGADGLRDGQAVVPTSADAPIVGDHPSAAH